MKKPGSVYVIGSYSTRFKKWLDKSMKDLTRDTYLGVLEDARMKDGRDIEFAWFGSCSMGTLWEQDIIRGHVCMSPLVEEGVFPERIPIINVEGACATASMAFHGAWKDILSGQCDVSLAIGVDKFYHPDMEKVLFAYEQGIDRSDKQRLVQEYEAVGKECGREFKLGPGHTIFMDTYAMQACWHMWRYGTTQRQIAIGASKNHYYGSLNPKAQYQFEVPVEKVLEDYMVSYPLTRSMCAPIGDGGAAAILCSEDYLKSQPPEVRSRAVKVIASVLSSGKHRDIKEPSLSKWASDRAYKMADLEPKDIDVAELHDATSFCEIYQAEMLGFCPIGEGGKFIESGATKLEGTIPVNTSGGLVSKGHPVGSTGLSMIYEIISQLRGEAGARQVRNAKIGLTENGGGVISTEEFSCCINILQKE
ncbi:MAG: thiolase family protein [Deltaproteobacteria bacterium]|nr:thiolase family protein [Deltaproteobacteria bacterium]MBW1934246.1 thiolase family protein [Deltaproteobacteria bacterium]MBW1977847.1 thiolase family protein [Deltaproteobacteria bacterium]MBW2044628.1 thiolase family protein [Deltaproteobacteria bacterium]MBW2298989.1 thiolase family protein [Deltaproteobacteria bacterium]